jgi:hypothetical protein
VPLWAYTVKNCPSLSEMMEAMVSLRS